MSNRFAILALAAIAGIAQADTVYWQSGPDTNWGNPANWIGHVPTSSDFVVITPGAGPLVRGITQISGLYIQPGAGMVIIGELYVFGGASIQGTMSIAGQSSRFIHRDDVNLEGTITMWDGSMIERHNTGNGIFTVRPSGTIRIPSYDTLGVTLGTYLQVSGTLRHESTHTLNIGPYFGSDATAAYIAIQTGGTMTFTHGGDVGRTYLTTQTPPYLANDGVIDISGAGSDVIDIAAEVAVFNSGIIGVNMPDLYIHTDRDIDASGTLIRGMWSCSNYGRIFFNGNPAIRMIGAAARVQLLGSGSTIIPNDQLTINAGNITLDNANTFTFAPVNGTFTNSGVLSIGPGSTFNCVSQFINSGAGTLECWLAGTQSNQIGRVVSNFVNLDGALRAPVASWFTPNSGDRFDVVTANTNRNGTFAQVTPLYTSTPFSSIYATSGMALLAGGCTADFNHDGVVDFFDYLDFVGAFSSSDSISDFNQDSVIDFFDYLDFVAAFSAGC